MVNKKDNTTILGIRIRKREQAAPVKNKHKKFRKAGQDNLSLACRNIILNYKLVTDMLTKGIIAKNSW